MPSILLNAIFDCQKDHAIGIRNNFAIFDGKEVFTGSYNWTNNAEHFNWENAVFLDDPKLIAGFQKEYEVLWKATPRPVIHKPQRRKLRSKALY